MKQTSLLIILLLALFAPGMANAQIIGVGGFPWTENFDSSSSATAHDTNALPDNWNYYNGTNSIYSGYPLIYNSSDYAHSGNHFLRFFSYYETDQDYTYTDQYAMLPAMQNVNHLRISFYARLGNDDYESSLVLGVMSDPADITTFDAIKTINPTSTNYELFTINLNKYTGTGSYIAFKMAPATENNHFYIICVDDITVEELPSCLEPSELKANQITSTSAKLSWESNGDEDSWTIYYKKSTDNEYTSVSVTDNPHTLSGLQSSTTYEYYVVANCSETDISEPSATISFTTYCDAVTAFPWTENFDSHTGSTSASSNNLPECWYYYNGTTNNNDNAGYPIIYDNSTNAHSGNNSLKFYSSYSSTQDDILYDNTDQYCILPAMEDVSSLRIKFYACQLSPVFNSYLVVGVMTNPEDISTFKAVSTITPASTTYELYEVHFDAYTDGGSFIAIMMPPANSVNIYRGIYVDDITVGEIPTCLEPTHLEANANSSSSANLSWDANNDEGSWTLYYKKSTDDAYTSVTVDSNPYTLSGLEAYTNYEYYVVAHCSETDLSEPSAVESFLTLCEALDKYPYTENFDGITGSNSGSNNVLPLCWQRVNTTTYGYYSGYPTVYADYASLLYSNSTPNCLRFFSLYRENQSYDPQPQYVILPEMQNLAGKKITLSAKGGNSTSYFKIGTMTDPTDTNTFSLIAEQELTTSYQEFVFYIPKYATTTPRFVAIMIDAANANKNEIEVFVDDISIDVEPCLTPYNLTISDVTNHAATLTWIGENQSYNVMYRVAAHSDGFNEHFNTSGIPLSWTRYVGLVDEVVAGTAELTYNNWGWSTNNHGLGYYNAKLNIFGNERNNWLVSPEITLNGDNGTVLNFDLALTCWGSSGSANGTCEDDRFVVLIYANDTWNILREWNNAGSEYVYTNIATTGEHVSIDLSSYADQTVQIAFYGESTASVSNGDNDVHIDNVGIGTYHAAGEWQTVESVTGTTYTLENLEVETDYEVKVASDCESESNHETPVYGFITDAACPAPANITISEASSTSAKLNWKGYSNSYNIQYNTSSYIDPIFSEDFSHGIGDWILENCTTNENPLYSTGIINETFQFYCNDNPPQYLISPEITGITEEVTIEFTYYNKGDYIEYFQVGLSSTGNDTTSFIWSETIIAKDRIDNLYHATVPAGTKYMAIKLLSNNQRSLFIDDIKIGPEIPAGNTLSVTSEEESVTLTDLTPNTEYDVSIQGVCDETVTGWSETVSFTPLRVTLLEIKGYGNSEKGGYYLIASPVDSISPAVVENMTSNSYDLYRFDQREEKEWINFKGTEESETYVLSKGNGYLYANSEDVTLAFPGEPNTEDYELTLTFEDTDFVGWNLVGNSSNQVMYLAERRDFYVMNDTRDGFISVNRAIQPMEGIFIVSETEGVTINFTKTAPDKKGASLALNLSQGRGTIDRAVVRFDEGSTLPKLQLRENSTKLYIPVDGHDYAVVRSEGMGELPLHFKAEENGSYTMSVSKEEVEFSYLHLIDNLTGADVDLLAQPSYHFEASTSDYASRFKLVFATSGSAQGDDFAFVSNGHLMIYGIEGNAVLKVMDLTGRTLSTESFSGSYDKTLKLSTGVYMIQLIQDTEVRTQKILL